MLLLMCARRDEISHHENLMSKSLVENQICCEELAECGESVDVSLTKFKATWTYAKTRLVLQRCLSISGRPRTGSCISAVKYCY